MLEYRTIIRALVLILFLCHHASRGASSADIRRSTLESDRSFFDEAQKHLDDFPAGGGTPSLFWPETSKRSTSRYSADEYETQDENDQDDEEVEYRPEEFINLEEL